MREMRLEIAQVFLFQLSTTKVLADQFPLENFSQD